MRAGAMETNTRFNSGDYLKFKLQNGNWELIAYTYSQAKRTPVNSYTVGKTDTTLCKGDTLVLAAGAGSDFKWFKNDNLLKNSVNSFLNIWDSGYYYAVKRNTTGGFDTSKRYRVAINSVGIPAQPTVQLNNQLELVATGGSGTWQWYKNGIAVQGAVGTLYKPADNGLYTAVLSNNGCNSDPSAQYHYVANALFQIDASQFVNVYPNPVTDFLYVSYKINNGNTVRLTITELNGKKLIERSNVSNGERVALDKLIPGVYIVTITIPGDKKPYSTKIIR